MKTSSILTVYMRLSLLELAISMPYKFHLKTFHFSPYYAVGNVPDSLHVRLCCYEHFTKAVLLKTDFRIKKIEAESVLNPTYLT